MEYDENVESMRSLLKRKGYVHFGASVYPLNTSIFLVELAKKLGELNTDAGEESVVPFDLTMRGSFDGKKFPVELDFQFAYRISTKELYLTGLEAGTFDSKVNYDFLGIDNNQLPMLETVKKDLKLDVIQKIREVREKFDHAKRKNVFNRHRPK